jgi:hypothetical protein
VYLVQENLARLENISVRHDFDNKKEKVILEASRNDFMYLWYNLNFIGGIFSGYYW